MSNSYHQEQNIVSLPTEISVVYAPGSYWTYNHHPHMTFYKNKFLAIWSNGTTGEDLPGQRVLTSSSADFYHWAAPTILVTPIPDSLLWTPGGLHVYNDTLVAFITVNSKKRTIVDFMAIYTVDGINWSTPIDLNVTTYPSHSPTVLSTGRLLLTGNTAVYYTDSPSGLRGWKRASVNGGTIPTTPALVEGTIIEQEDHTILCMLRSVTAGYKNFNWQMKSVDNGKSFSVPVKTNFTDNNSKSHLGRLPNGEYYYVGTPDTTAKTSVRTPLVLSLSTDGIHFDRNYIIGNNSYVLKYPGQYKSGQYGYPDATVHGGYLYVFASKIKEQMELIRIPLKSFMLQKNILQNYSSKEISQNPVIDGSINPENVTGWMKSPTSIDTSPLSGVITNNGIITINGTSGTQARFETVSSRTDLSDNFTIYLKCFVVPKLGAANAGRGLDIEVNQGTARSLITIDENSLQLYNSATALCSWNNERTFHTFRFAYQQGVDSIFCFVNGAYVGSVKSSPTSIVQPYIRFGKGNSVANEEIQIDYLHVDTLGSFLIKDNPSTTCLPTKTNIFLYPNPCNDFFYVNINDIESTQLSIYNLNGILIKEIEIKSEDVVPVSDLKKGIYFVRISNRKNIYIMKFTKS
jgi:hypothetical protein